MAAWHAELVFRGHLVRTLSGECPHADIVVIRFASLTDAKGWYRSAEYQDLIPLREQAAEVVLTTYET